jgi:IS4 transposase
VRNKRHVKFYVARSSPVDKACGLRCDQRIRINSEDSKNLYRSCLRRIHFRDPQENRSLVFLTNDFDLPASVICELYKRRWQVELFFKWIKQHLRIRNFFGHSANAVLCQIWSAICAYLLVAIAKKRLEVDRSLYEILQIVSISALEQIPLPELLSTTSEHLNKPDVQNPSFLLAF